MAPSKASKGSKQDKAKAGKKAPVKPTGVKKAPVKPTGVKKAPVKPTGVKKAPVKPTGVKKAPVKPTGVKKAPVKPTGVKKAPVKPTGVKKAPVKPTGVKKAPVKPTGVKKAPVKPTGVKKASVKSRKQQLMDALAMQQLMVAAAAKPSDSMDRKLADPNDRYKQIDAMPGRPLYVVQYGRQCGIYESSEAFLVYAYRAWRHLSDLERQRWNNEANGVGPHHRPAPVRGAAPGPSGSKLAKPKGSRV